MMDYQPVGIQNSPRYCVEAEERRARNSLYVKYATNQLDIEKKAVLSDMYEQSSVRRAMALSDVRAEKELQKTIVSFTEDGEVVLQKKAFNQDIVGRLPLKILDAALLCHLNDIEPRALSVCIEKAKGKTVTLFWNLSKTENRWIRQLFEKNGISFGFGDKKEMEIRRKLLNAVMNIAPRHILPERHGWYAIDGKWHYAYPNDVSKGTTFHTT